MKYIVKFLVILSVLLPLGILLVAAVPEMHSLLSFSSYWIGLCNSIWLTVVIVVFQMLIAVPAAYGLARWRGRIRNGIYFLYCLLNVIPCQAMLLPNYLVCRTLGLLNTSFSVILIGVFSPLVVFLLARQMQKIDGEQANAATLDGANEMQIFIKIYLPQVENIIWIAGVLAFVDCWSMIELPLILLSDEEKQPLSLLLAQTDFPAPYAGATVYMVPIVVALVVTYCVRVFRKRDST